MGEIMFKDNLLVEVDAVIAQTTKVLRVCNAFFKSLGLRPTSIRKT